MLEIQNFFVYIFCRKYAYRPGNPLPLTAAADRCGGNRLWRDADSEIAAAHQAFTNFINTIELVLRLTQLSSSDKMLTAHGKVSCP